MSLGTDQESSRDWDEQSGEDEGGVGGKSDSPVRGWEENQAEGGDDGDDGSRQEDDSDDLLDLNDGDGAVGVGRLGQDGAGKSCHEEDGEIEERRAAEELATSNLVRQVGILLLPLFQVCEGGTAPEGFIVEDKEEKVEVSDEAKEEGTDYPVVG